MEKKIKGTHLIADSDAFKVVNNAEIFASDKSNVNISYHITVIPANDMLRGQILLPYTTALIIWDTTLKEYETFLTSLQ